MKPGIYPGLSFADYLKDPCEVPSLSSSVAFTLVNDSPLHAWQEHPRLNPKREIDASKASELGTACHAALLERSTETIVWVDAQDWKKGEPQKIRNEARAAGKVALLERQRPDLEAMYCKAMNDVADSEDLRDIFEDGDPEQTVIWQDGASWCRCRPDWLSGAQLTILDYKTSGSADPESFLRVVESKGYDLRAEFCRRGVQAITGTRPEFFWLVQETSAPFDCSIVGPGPQMVAIAEDRMRRALARWAECMESKRWPGRSKRTAWLEPRPWSVQRWENQEIGP